MHPHIASIVNWDLSGSGDSPEEALQSLKDNIATAKAKKKENGDPVPRHGTHVPIGFASQERVNSNKELADDFIRRVLGLPWAWISDGSSLWDFHSEDTNDAYCANISAVYRVDVSDIESGNLSEILERIATTQMTSRRQPSVIPRCPETHFNLLRFGSVPTARNRRAKTVILGRTASDL
jgi:hypothetical protein